MTRAGLLGHLRRGDRIVVTKANSVKGDAYHLLHQGEEVSHRIFNSVRCCLAPADPGLMDDEPQTWALDPERLPKAWKVPA
jgi:hypothetical protein